MTIRAKSEDLPRLIAETKGIDEWTFAGKYVGDTPLDLYQPHTAEGAHHALQLLCEITQYHMFNDSLIDSVTASIHNHNNTPESICEAICLAWLAANGINVELED